MRPKGKLFALLAIFAAIGIVTATGAFTTVTAERTTNVTVAGDSSALLALAPADSPNGNAYAQENNGQLELSLNGDFSGTVDGSGVNLNARTTVDTVFNITNQGSQDVGVYISKIGPNAGLVQFYNGSVGSGLNMTSSSNAQTVSPGETITVSIEIDTVGAGLSPGDQLVSDIEINADADLA